MAQAGIGLVYGGGGLGLMGDGGAQRAGARRPRHRHHPGVPLGQGADAERCRRTDRHGGHARAQAADVRALGRLRRSARRHRHAGGADRAADLVAARPSRQADRAGQHRRLLGAAARPARPMRDEAFIRPGLEVRFLVVDRPARSCRRSSLRQGRGRTRQRMPRSPQNSKRSLPYSSPTSSTTNSATPTTAILGTWGRRRRDAGRLLSLDVAWSRFVIVDGPMKAGRAGYGASAIELL